MPRGMNPSWTPCYISWIQVRSATPLNIKTVRCDNHEVCSRQEVKNMRYTHLTENERYMISALRKQGISTAKIAKQLGRHKATIYREIERNSRYNRHFKRYSYQAWRAQQMARNRLSRSRRKASYYRKTCKSWTSKRAWSLGNWYRRWPRNQALYRDFSRQNDWLHFYWANGR